MEQVVLVIHLLIAVALIGVVLVQKSEGGLGGLGGGSGGGGFGGLMTTRGSANLLTRATAVLAAVFMLTSIALVMIAGGHGKPRSILDALPQNGPTTGAPATTAPQTGQKAPAPNTATPNTATPNTAAPATPAKPPAGGAAPSVPVSK